MLYAARNCRAPIDVEDPRTGEYELVLFLGPDHNGLALEVMGRVRADGGVTLFHAMKMRDQYEDFYKEVMGW